MSKYYGNVVTTGANAGYSVAFNGSTDYLSIPTNAAFSFSTNDFTIETWFYASALTTLAGGGNGIFTSIGSVGLYVASDGVRITQSGTAVLNDVTTTISTNTWYHLALTRTGTSMRVFLNGTQVGSTLSNSTNFSNTGNVRIGTETTQYFNGYISNARVLKGTALYTSNFTPPTQLFNITNTSILTCNSPAIIDQGTANSGSGFPITVNGSAKVSTFTPFAGYQAYNPALGAATPGIWTVSDALQAAGTRRWNMYDPYFNLTTLKLGGNTPTNIPMWIADASGNNIAVTAVGDSKAASQSPFSLSTYPNSGSGYFDGSGDYLLTPANQAALNLTGDCSIECFFYTTFGSAQQAIIACYGGSGGNQFVLETYTGKIYCEFLNGATSYNYTSTSSYSTTGWNHVLITKSGTTAKMWLNGVYQNSWSVTSVGSVTQAYAIGAFGTPGTYFTGYISNVRIIKGVAIETGTSNITVPTAPLSAVSGTSLLTLQNSQPSANNSFTDSSSNNFAITRNGTPTQGSFTPFSQTGWGNYFDGSSALNLPSTSALTFGAGDFCVEFWLYKTTSSTGVGIFSNSQSSGGGDTQFEIQIQSSTGYIALLGWNTVFITGTTAIGQNTWYHIAVVRSGTSMAIFVNGVRDATATSANNFSSANNFTIARQASTGFITGYLSNFRAVKGSSVYSPSSTTITVPTAPLTNITNTSVLTCQSNRFVDNGTANAGSGFAITLTGTPSVQAFSPFQTNVAYTPAVQGGSFYSSASDWLSVPYNSAFDLSTGDFTVEGWIYPTSYTGDPVILGTYGAGGIQWIFELVAAGSVWNVYVYPVGTNLLIYSGAGPALNSWTHFALTRDGANFKFYVNGVLLATVASQTLRPYGTQNLNISAYSDGGGGFWRGYIGQLRIVKGTAVYTGAFTPPNKPVATSGAASAASYSSTTNVNITFPASNTSLLTNFFNAAIVDSTGKNDFVTVGNAAVSTVQSKYGGSSIYFDGSGDRLYEPSNQNYNFGSGDFTIELWVNPISQGGHGSSNNDCLIDFRDGAGTAVVRGTLYIYLNGTGVYWYVNGANRITGGAISNNTWTHIALCRASGNTRLFINGTQSGSTYVDANVYLVSPIMIGEFNDGTGGGNFYGYMQDIRITKYARYLGNFTPPTSLLQNQ